MNVYIINNLYEFWTCVGKLTGTLVEADNYSYVLIPGSDWPNRVFNLNHKGVGQVLKLSRGGVLPKLVAVDSPDGLSRSDFEFVFRQKNMALDLKSHKLDFIKDPNIREVKNQKDALDFARAASGSFGYNVSSDAILKVINNPDKIRLFNYKKGSDTLGSGIVFFDSANHAGLHMIGTLPQGRGQGIGKRMTEALVMEAKKKNKDFCVLHASAMGEPIYRKLGFHPYGEIETYRVLNKKQHNPGE